MKAVTLLLFIGLIFLLIDMLTDRSLKKFFKKRSVEQNHKTDSNKNGNDHHKKAGNDKKGK
jgi:hypothetical protein